MEMIYAAPIEKLIKLGEPKTYGWLTYATLGVTTEHIPDLLRVLESPEFDALSREHPELWAPLHAWRALAQLGVLDLVSHLLARLDEFREDNWDDYLLSDFSQAVALIGPAALEPLIEWIEIPGNVGFSAWTVAGGIAAVGRAHPELRERALGVLEAKLRNWRDYSPEHNASLISTLIDIRATESIPLIREVMEAEAADETIVGSLEYVEYDLGLRDRPPVPRYGQLSFAPDLLGGTSDAQTARNAKERARARRKASKASKKRNRKR
jgi:hypothetical protein